MIQKYDFEGGKEKGNEFQRYELQPSRLELMQRNICLVLSTKAGRIPLHTVSSSHDRLSFYAYIQCVVLNVLNSSKYRCSVVLQ